MVRIAIVGGGVIGLSCAVRLAQNGFKVTLFDASSGRSAASWGNAGHIATEQVAPLASPSTLRSIPRRLFPLGGALDLPPRWRTTWLPFAMKMLAASTPRRFARGKAALAPLLAEALPAWQDLSSALGAPDLVRADGHFVAWETPATARAGRTAWAAADIGTTRVSPATPAEMDRLRELGPLSLADAVRFTGSGQIHDLRQLAAALETALSNLGGEIICEAATLAIEDGKAVLPGIEADIVLVTAGARSAPLLRPAGYRVPLIAERGYHIRASAERWPSDLPPVVYEDRSMIVTRYADQVQAASFVEFGPVDAPADPRKWERLERHVRELGLPISRPFERWMGARPTLPDYLPAIGRSRRYPGLLYAFGHQHLGLTLAPVTANIVTRLAQGREPGIDISPFDIERFSRKVRQA